MIVMKGLWNCFHCGTEYPNRVLHCDKCNASKKHSKNMRDSLGMNTTPDMKGKRKGDDMAKRRETRDKYTRNKSRFEGFVSKFFRYALRINVFKDESNRIKKPEDTLYYGFDEEGFHYTVRRDKIST